MILNDSLHENEALLFIPPLALQSHDIVTFMPWPLLIIGAMLKLIEWLERIV